MIKNVGDVFAHQCLVAMCSKATCSKILSNAFNSLKTEEIVS